MHTSSVTYYIFTGTKHFLNKVVEKNETHFMPNTIFTIRLVVFEITQRKGANISELCYTYIRGFFFLVSYKNRKNEYKFSEYSTLFFAISCNIPHMSTYPLAFSKHLWSQTQTLSLTKW
jgi:hypothetical protein